MSYEKQESKYNININHYNCSCCFCYFYSNMSLSKHNNKVLQAKKEQEYRIYYQDSVKFINDSATIMNFSKLNEDTIRIALIYYENILKIKLLLRCR